MTEQERLKSQIRESHMRLRELRTENAELKIQYRRWLNLSALISSMSLVLSLVMVFFPREVRVEVPVQQTISDFTAQQGDRDDFLGGDVHALPNDQGEALPESSQGEVLAPSLGGLEVLMAPDIPVPIAEVATPADRKSSSPLDIDDSRGIDLPKMDFALPGVGENIQRVEQYLVRKNDNLWGIVKRFYGSATPAKVAKVARDNGLVGSRIKPGMTLMLIIDD